METPKFDLATKITINPKSKQTPQQFLQLEPKCMQFFLQWYQQYIKKESNKVKIENPKFDLALKITIKT